MIGDAKDGANCWNGPTQRSAGGASRRVAEATPPPRLAHALLARTRARRSRSTVAWRAVAPRRRPCTRRSAQEIQNCALNWEPVVAIVFFTALIFVLWRTLKVMPRIKPQQIKPASKQSVTFADIAGVDEAKAELQEIVEFLRDPKPFQALGAKVPKGILLHGPPGTGKTLLAKAVAHESGAQFFAQSAASFVEMFAGLGAARIRRLFAIARKHEPAIIFIDELDAVGGRRGIGHLRREGPDAQPAAGRDGRLRLERARGRDRRVEPAGEARPGAAAPGALRPPGVRRAARRARGAQGVLAVHTRDKPLEDVDLGLVAQQTSGLTGADLANICNEAAIFATRRGAQRDHASRTSTRRSSG